MATPLTSSDKIVVELTSSENPTVAERVKAFTLYCRQLSSRYQDAVVKDPSFATKVEAAIRILSYIVPGRFGGTQELSEFAYCISNLFTLLNNYIISNKCPSSSSIAKLCPTHQKLLWLLGLIDCCEVVTELVGQRLWREVGKWLTIFLMRILKAVLQLITVYKYRVRILTTPPVPNVDRTKTKGVPSDVVIPNDDNPVAYRGARTGKIIRSMHTDPGIPYDDLPMYMGPSNGEHSSLLPDTSRVSLGLRQLTAKEILAETLHVARPLIHIVSMVVFKQESFKPWTIALIVDLLSLHLHGGLVNFKTKAPSEMLRRRLVLLLYLLRSPFYDSGMKTIIIEVLKFLAKYIPLGRWIVDPVLEYLPIWQQTYSYSWMS